MKVHLIAGLFMAAVAAAGAPADIILVPDDYPTIQEAINAAQDGDEIVVSEGTYTENIDFLGKDIVVRSTDPSDPAVVDGTIIDGNQAGTVVTMTRGTIQGFTIRNGLAVLAGGIHALNVAEIRNNVITGNTATTSAGGIYADGDILIDNNVITGNVAEFNSGGGVYASTRAIIVRNLISANAADVAGGGVVARHNCVVRNNLIVGNRVNYGGAVDARDNAAVRSNLIAGNLAFSDGGGVYGAIHWGGHNGAITGNTIVGNIALDNGSGIRADQGVVSSNIVAFSPSDRTAVAANSNAYVDYNCVFGNAGPAGTSGPNDIEADPLFVVGPSGFWTAAASFDPSTYITTLTDAGADFAPGELVGGLINPNIEQDLRFAIVANTQNTISVMGYASDPIVWVLDDYIVYDYHIFAEFPQSPCISAGDPTQPVDFYTGTDIDGEPRLQDCNPDIGADETPGPTTFVLSIVSTMTPPVIEVSVEDCNGMADGAGSFNRFYDDAPMVMLTAEELEFIPFHWIINDATQPDGQHTIAVDMSEHVSAQAEYFPVVNVTRDAYFTTIQSAISDFGTADGDEIVAAPSVYLENIDFLDKEITVQSVDPTDPEIVAATVIDGNNQDTVVLLSAGMISGFTIRNGFSGVDVWGNGTVSYNTITGNAGSGVTAADNAFVHHNTILGNTGYVDGVGDNARDDVIISDNAITGNTSLRSSGAGGGVYVRHRCLARNNVIANNEAVTGGGAAAVDDAVLSQNTIADNVATNRAGGVFCRDEALIINNLITGNESQDVENGGGGIYAFSTAMIIGNAIIANTSLGPGGGAHLGFGADLFGNTIVGNSCVTVGSGIYTYDLHEQFLVRHNIVAFNTGGWGIYADEPVDLDYNCVFGHPLGDYGGLASPGVHDINLDPLLEPDRIHLKAESPCINAGDPNFRQIDGQTDIDGDPRVVYERVDIGADEWINPGDFEGDADVDFGDFASFQLCYSGPTDLPDWQAPSSDCQSIFDFDDDIDIDLDDFNAFLSVFTGPR